MRSSIFLKVVLVLGALAFLIAGGVSALAPEHFTSRNGVDIGGQVSLINDYRGFGGILVGAGIIILLGVIHKGMTFTSTVVMTVIFSTFTLGRVMSIAIDGSPAEGLVKATIVEGVLAVLAIVCLVKFREKK